MQVIDGTLFDYRGPIYITLFSRDGMLGMTTYQMREYFGISQVRLTRAMGSLNLKGCVIDTKTAKLLRRSGLIPAIAKDPKFWTLEQVEALVSATPNKNVPVRLKRLKSFLPAQDLPSFESLGSLARQHSLFEKREEVEEAKARAAIPLCYTSKCILEAYPDFIKLVRAYSDENKAKVTWNEFNQDEGQRDRIWTLDHHSVYTMASRTLSMKYKIRTNLRVSIEIESGTRKGQKNYVRLYPRTLIDEFMASQGILRKYDLDKSAS